MPNESPPRFVFCTCQVGAEAVCKAEVLERFPFLAFAFSRPGFLTFKISQPVELQATFSLVGTFVRTAGWSIGSVQGSVGEAEERILGLLASGEIQKVHVWPRDRAVPGDDDFEPGPSPESEQLAGRLSERLAAHPSVPESVQVNVDAEFGETVLDCVLIESELVWLGRHVASTVPGRWPGGISKFERPEALISRAYLKTREALAWARFPLVPEDRCMEIGAAPGGSSQALLEAGLQVLAIDPAELHPSLLGHPRLNYFRGRARDIRRGRLRGVRWLFADLNVAPNYTLDAVGDIVGNSKTHLQGMILTLKLMHWELAADIPMYVSRVKEMGFEYVRTRQLAHNRREFCLAALLDKSMRAE